MFGNLPDPSKPACMRTLKCFCIIVFANEYWPHLETADYMSDARRSWLFASCPNSSPPLRTGDRVALRSVVLCLARRRFTAPGTRPPPPRAGARLHGRAGADRTPFQPLRNVRRRLLEECVYAGALPLRVFFYHDPLQPGEARDSHGCIERADSR